MSAHRDKTVPATALIVPSSPLRLILDIFDSGDRLRNAWQRAGWGGVLSEVEGKKRGFV